jgi:hypothetical protein
VEMLQPLRQERHTGPPPAGAQPHDPSALGDPLTKRRSRGDSGLHWDDRRQRWIATASMGYGPNGKRITRRGSGKTTTEAKDRLKEFLRPRGRADQRGQGRHRGRRRTRLAGLRSQWHDVATVEHRTILANCHVIPAL